MDKTFPGTSTLQDVAAAALACHGGSSSITPQQGQAHQGRALPSCRESASVLTLCSFYY